jgi:pyoverdine/dityrosine biosynthesis protein Dit1
LIGWTHTLVGRHQAWANELAQSFPEYWAKSIHREWHHGHKHKKGEVKVFPIVTQGGVLMRQLTALSPIDYWHYDNLYTDAVPGGESFVMHKEKGVIANFTAWTDHTHIK